MLSLFLYNIGLRAYGFLLFCLSPFHTKASLWYKGRKNIFDRIRREVNPNNKNAWFHVSSLGEFEQGRPVMEAFKKDYPEYKIILTFFSPSGYEVRKNYAGADAIFYLPLDTRANAKKFLNIVNPQVAFFVKYEFWFHYLKALHKRKVPTIIFSAIFRPKQLFFKWYGKWYSNMLKCFTHLFVQNQESKDCLQQIGITNVTIAGDTRFDRVAEIAQQKKDLKLIEDFVADSDVLVAGSTWPIDEEYLHAFLQRSNHRVKIILAPHEIHDKHVEQIVERFGDMAQRYSQLDAGINENTRLVIVDNMGLLSSLYAYGQVAYIGGGFGAGIHNTLEAATYGVPVVFGSNYRKFQEAKDLITAGGGFTIKNQDELVELLTTLFADKNKQKLAGDIAGNYVVGMCGGTQKIRQFLAENPLK